jgi:YegS/Rv2252/BmrU family lipid kinase
VAALQSSVSPPIPVVLNLTAGLGHSEEGAERLRQTFARYGVEARVVTARSGTEIERHVDEALASGARIVVAGGGDGTISAVAARLRSTDVALGILPIGTLNHFARDLGIPVDAEAAVRVVAEGRRAAVDVGEVNGRAFINNASLGMYPDIVRDRKRQQRRLGRGKYWAMLWATLAFLRRSPFMRLHMEIHGEGRDCRSPFVFIGNNDYVMEGFTIGQRPSVRDGCLSIYTTQRCGRWALLRLAVRALFGRLHQADDFSSLRAERLRIDSHRRRMLVATDGEVTAMDTPLEFRVLPGALQVIVPA